MPPAGIELTDAAIDTKPVEEMLQFFVKGLRAAQLYLPNNPVYQQALGRLQEAFAPVWEATGSLVLDVKETQLRVGEVAVLDQPQKSESIAWVLYKDGVRAITLNPGCEDEEVVQLLDVINKAKNLTPDADDDLLTLLWEQDFHAIEYTFTELATEDAKPLEAGEPAAPGDEAPATVQEEVKEEVAQPEGVVRLEDFDSTLYFLDENDIAYLKGEVEREYQQDLRLNVLAMLFDIFELQTFSTVRAEVASIVENFIPYLLGAGDFRSVAYVLGELGVLLERAREVLPEQREQLESLPSRLSEPDAVAQLLQSLDEAATHPTEGELEALFGELNPEALETILAWFPRLVNARVKELLQHAIRRIAIQNPDELAKAMGNEDEAVVLETVHLARDLKLPPVVAALGGLLVTDRSAEVKVATVEALAAIGSPGAMQQLEKAVGDRHRDVRIAVVRTLGTRRHRAALSRIEPLVFGKQMRDADLTEKMAFFEAYGLLAGAPAIEKLVPLLSAGGFMRKGQDPQTRACAAMALGKIGTPESRAALEGAKNDKDPLVRNAINKALREGSE